MPKKLTTEEFIEKAKSVHGDKYDYSKVEYVNNSTKVEIICKECGLHFFPTPNNHICRKSGCPRCSANINTAKQRKSLEQFIEEARKIHGDKYDYSKVEYKTNKTKVKIICKECRHEFLMEPRRHLKGFGCPNCGVKIEVKKINKNLKNTGRAHTTQQFIELARKVHGDRYDYSKVEYINSHTKVCIICPIHGEFWQNPTDHLRSGCFKCGKMRKSTQKFIEEACKIHGDKYDYSKVNYINNYTKIEIICKECGNIFWQEPRLHLSGNCGCPECNISKGEERIKLYLKKHNYNFIHNQPCLDFLAPQRPDFYLPDYNLVIEYDGEQHFGAYDFFGGEAGYELNKERDNRKNKLCEEYDVRIIRIPYWDFDNIENILEEKLNDIRNYLL